LKRDFLLNIVFLLLVNLLFKPFYIFGIDRTVQNLVGAPAYGVYFALFNFTFLFQILNDFGIQNFNARLIARQPHLLDQYFPNILTLKLLLAALYLLFMLLAAWAIGYTWALLPMLIMLCFNQILTTFIFYLRSNVAGLGWYRVDSLLSTLDRFLMIVVVGALIWVQPFGNVFRIEWLVYSQTLTLSITAFAAFAIVWQRLTLPFRWRFDGQMLRQILRESYPFALVLLLMTIYGRIDAILIERLLPNGAHEAGIYAAAYRLLDAANALGLVVANLLIPMFARQTAQKTDIKPLLRLGVAVVMCLAIVLASAVWWQRTNIMQALYHETTAQSANILGVLMWSFVAISGNYLYGALLTANGDLMRMNRIFVIAIVVNVLGNILILPYYGALGAAIVTLMTEVFSWLAQVFLAKKIFSLRRDVRWVLQFFALATLTVGVGGALETYFLGHWIVKFLLNILSGGVFALLLGLIDVRSFLRLLWKREKPV
jgi:O-antigen/teichoic acid export membrane protein